MQISVRRSGFSLVEISIVLVVVATMLAGVLPAITESAKVRAVDQTADRMKEIEDSLQAYFAANSALPCPSDITQAVNNANFGKKAANATCQGGTPAANWGPVNAAGGAGNVVGGGVPTKDLGLPDEVAFDGWGHRFAYHVDRTATVAGTFATSGAITVNGTGGALRSSTAVYALISAGKNGHGGYGRAASRFDAGSTNADEWSNCQSATATCGGAPASYNATFVQRLEQADSAAPTNKFDDLVVYKLRGHLTAGGGGSSFWAGSGADIYNTNSGNVGVGTTAPSADSKLDIQTTAGPSLGNIKVGTAAGRSIWMAPHIGNGSWNPLSQAGDQAIFFAGNGIDTGNLLIAPWASTSAGLRMTSAGNVGIGTASPPVTLTVGDPTNGYGTMLINRQNTVGNEGGEIELAAGTTGQDLFYIDNYSSGANQELRLRSATSPSLLTLNKSGNIGMGTDTPGIARLNVTNQGTNVGLYVGDVGSAPYGQAMIEINPPAAATHIWASEAGTRVFSVTGGGAGYFAGGLTVNAVSGTPTSTVISAPNNPAAYYADWPATWGGGLATWDVVGASTLFSAYQTRSDRRYKKDIVELDADSSMDGLMRLKPVSYHWKDERMPQNTQFGLIAQDVEKIWPNLVSKAEGKKGRLSMNYDGLFAPIIVSVQELNRKVDVLSAASKSPSTEKQPEKDSVYISGQMIFNLLMGLGLAGLYLRGAKRR